jgi:hypothetical protein
MTVSRQNALIALCGLLFSSGVHLSANPPQDTKADVEKIADKLKFFVTPDFLFDRHESHFYLLSYPPDMVKEYHDLIRPLADSKTPVDAWIGLLKHPDARVRTLALAALFAREDPKLLPHLASLLEDKAATFAKPPWPSSGGMMLVNPKFDPKTLEAQTVGDVAGAMVGFYLWRVGVDLHNRKPTLAEFKSYWDARKDRSHCASWYAVKFARATQGTSPVAKDRAERIQALRKMIDTLAPRERAWVFLWLMEDDGSRVLIPRDELVVLTKELGPDRLLGLLRREADTDDPDWAHPQKRGTWRLMVAFQFVLGNADKLLRPKDAQSLLDLEWQERQSVKKGNVSPILTAYWAIGAAQLAPDAAPRVLIEAFDRYEARYQKQDRALLALALWRTEGLKQHTFLMDWFFKEVPNPNEFGFGRVAFLASIPDVRTADNRKLIAAIVRDKRFESVDRQTLDRMVRIVNGWTGKPVFDPEMLRGTSPSLEPCRAALRDSVPQWEKEPMDK